VAFGWRQESLTANAERIRELGESLYQRLATFSEHLPRLGRSLGGAVSDYNKAVGSFEAKVLPGADKQGPDKANVDELKAIRATALKA